MNVNPTRPRQPNLTLDEKLQIVQLINKDRNIIENKATDLVTMAEKNECWLKITKLFNGNLSTSSPSYRSTEQIKNFWTQMKSHTKQLFAKYKRQQRQTGGGQIELAFNCVEEMTYNIIKPSIEGLNNPYDNDSEYNINNDENENPASTNDPVFEYLLDSKSITNWNKWAPAKLKNPLAEPLKNITSRRSLSNDQFEPVASTSSGMTSSTKRSCAYSETTEILQSKKLKLITVMEERMKKRETLDDLKEKVLQTKLKAESLKLKLLEKTVQNTNNERIQNAHDYEDIFNISDSDE